MEAEKEPLICFQQKMNQSRARKEFSAREMRGMSIVFKGGMIKRKDENTYLVRSSTLEKWYKVSWRGKRWICECKDHEKRTKSCKHVFSVLFLSRLPYVLMANFQSSEVRCPCCNSNSLRRKGLSYLKEFAAQRYQCKNCGKKFDDKGESKGLKGNPLAVVAVTDLFFKGLSLRQIEHHMKSIYSLRISYSTIHRWIRRMINNMKTLEKEHSLKVGKRWHLDETIIKIDGKLAYLWNCIDAETRVLLASQVTYGRSSEDAEMVIREALRRAQSGLEELEIVTDGLKSYPVALSKEYDCKIKHISKPKFTDSTNNNLAERINETVKGRMRNFRRLSNQSSASELFEGFRMYYNSKRPHLGLDGRTPIDFSLDSGKNKQGRI